MLRKKAMIGRVLVGVILVLVAFGILFLIYNKAYGSIDIGETACEQSAHSKASLPSIAKEIPPLKCRTKKYCITDDFLGKGNCEEFIGGDYEKFKVSGSSKEKQIQINDFLARKQARCWSMLGKGDLSIFSREFTGTISKKCVICYKIAFDESLKGELGSIEGLGNYLMTHKVPGKEISYWEYITSGLDSQGYDEKEDILSMDEKAIVYMELSKSVAYEWTSGLVGAGGGGLAGAYAGASIGSIVPGAGTFAGGFIGFVGGSLVGGVLGKEVGEEITDELIEELEGDYAAANFFMDYDNVISEKFDCYIESIA